MTTMVIDTLPRCNLDSATISYNATLAKPIDSAVAIDSLDAPWVERPYLLSRLQASDNTQYEFVYSPGPSCDPWFGVNRQGPQGKRELGGYDGLHLCIPGDGFIYVSGH